MSTSTFTTATRRPMSILSVVSTVRPDEIYNLAAQSHVQVSFDVPEFTADVDATGVLRALAPAPVRPQGYLPHLSGIYVRAVRQGRGGSQNENTPFHPTAPTPSPQYGLDCKGIMRSLQYVLLLWCLQPRVRSAAVRPSLPARSRWLPPALHRAKQDKLYLGNLSSLRRLGLCQGLCRVHVADFAER